jgi:hypothetical protein
MDTQEAGANGTRMMHMESATVPGGPIELKPRDVVRLMRRMDSEERFQRIVLIAVVVNLAIAVVGLLTR